MKKLIAANWKMHKTAAEAVASAAELAALLSSLPRDREVLVFPPFTALVATVQILTCQPGFAVGGQNFYPANEGAFTGEISPNMLLAAGCTYGLAGHSERRYVLGETDELISRKVAFGLQGGLKVVMCIGEKIEERENGHLETVLTQQLTTGLSRVPKDISPKVLTIAYEPIWAIGTGKVAGPIEILEIHAVIRRLLVKLLPATGMYVRILYGGSVAPENCDEIILLDNVDGVLVGTASLQAKSFDRIVRAGMLYTSNV